MSEIKHHSSDKTYKIIYKILGVKFHQYLYGEGEKIEFMDTEIPYTAQRRDITTRIDGKLIVNTEFMSTPLYGDKLHTIYDYHQDLCNDKNNDDMEVVSNVVSTANPNYGFNDIDIDSNINFHLKTIHIKKKERMENFK